MFMCSIPSNKSSTLIAAYHKHKQEKCGGAYERRIHEVEHDCIVFSTSGGMGKAVTIFYKHLAIFCAPIITFLMGWLGCINFFYT